MLRLLCSGIFATIAVMYAESPKRSLGIFLKFDANPAQSSLQAMKDEVTRILRPAGFAVYWRSLDDNPGTESFSDIAVFQFHGSCKVQSAHSADPSREITLATTSISDGNLLPFSDVSCDEVAQVLPAAPGDRQKALGRILGRVMVHELFHSLAKATLHTTRGIRKSTHAAFDLASGSLRLDAAETRLLLTHSAK